MTAARHFQSGLQVLRQIKFALFDMRLHDDYDAFDADRIQSVLDAVRDRFTVVHPPAFNRFPHAFSHIFAGGYAAGYYSHKWAEVLSADAYSAFEEAAVQGDNVVSTATGLRFQKESPAVGGSRPAIESLKAFRDREPRIDALLRHRGMTA